ncbi:MAG: SCO family protein [Pseudomonadota bacterium]
MNRITLLAATATVSAVLLGGAAYFVLGGGGDNRFAQCDGGQVAGGEDLIGGPFELVDARLDQAVTETDVIDGMTLIYFGYTFCPDICPFDVSRNAEATEILEEGGINLTPVMITVDPQRDTVDVMANYADAMHPRMVGLTGSDEQVEVAKKAYRAYGARASGGSGEDYLVDHSTLSYLMHSEEGFLGFFRRDIGSQELADRIACFAEAI